MSSIRPTKNPNRTPESPAGGFGEVVALNSDLFFGVTIGNQLKKQGYTVSFRKTTGAFAEHLRSTDAVLGVIDLNAKPDWSTVAKLIEDVGERTPILVFGSHLDVDGLRAAKAVGVRRVVSNSDFHQNMSELVKRYARTDRPAG